MWIHWEQAFPYQPTKSHIKTCRPVTDTAIKEFARWVAQHPMAEVAAGDSVEENLTAYQDTVMQACHRCFLNKTVKFHPSDIP